MTARELRALLALALRASDGRGAHAEAARNIVLTILLAQLLAAGAPGGQPPPAPRAPRHARPRRQRRVHRASLAGRRPRG
ncbi:MAG TPA: hypothetical protein VH418_05370 [Solirubrobacteraceae bacterium]